MNGDKIFRVKSYLLHKLKALPHGGFGIHSPYVFNFVTHVLDERSPYYAYDDIEKLRRNLLSDRTSINITDFGSKPSRERRICEIARNSCKNKNDAQLLFRIAISLNAKNILELGTSLGLTTAYLAKSNSQARIISLEGCPETAKIARRNLEILNIRNVVILTGNIDETLKPAIDNFENLDLVFIDANHRKAPTLSYFETCLNKASKKSIFVIDDIYHSREMNEAWNIIKRNPKIKVSIDLFHMGILIINDEIQPGEYRIRK